MKPTTIATCLAAAVLLAASPAAAGDDLVDLPSSAQGERIGTAAGKAKPLFASVPMTCEGSICRADFGKKNGKTRSVEWITCVVTSANGMLMLAAPAIGESLIGYMDVTSRGIDGTKEMAVVTFTNRFEAPSGGRLFVLANTSGTPTGGQCMLSGTIE